MSIIMCTASPFLLHAVHPKTTRGNRGKKRAAARACLKVDRWVLRRHEQSPRGSECGQHDAVVFRWPRGRCVLRRKPITAETWLDKKSRLSKSRMVAHSGFFPCLLLLSKSCKILKIRQGKACKEGLRRLYTQSFITHHSFTNLGDRFSRSQISLLLLLLLQAENHKLQ